MTRSVGTLTLTFDDGPDPTWTPRVLDQLETEGVVATFFVLGSRVRQAPELVASILAGGHRVELHGDRHLDHRTAPRDQLASDTRAALATLQSVGVAPTLWRLPWGRPGPTTAGLAREHGLEIVHWDVDPHDWRGDGWADQPTDRRAALRSGGVVLLHDAIGPGAPRSGCANTIELVEAIVREATGAGGAIDALPGRGTAHV